MKIKGRVTVWPFFWPTMDLAEIQIYGGLICALSHEHVFELTTAYVVT